MKGWIILLLLLASVAYADIEFNVNGAPLGDRLLLEPGVSIPAEVTVAKGVKILDANVESENIFYQNLLESIFTQPIERSGESQTKPFDIDVPDTLPKGDAYTTVTLTYEDYNFNKQTKTFSTTVVVEEGSAFLNFILGLVPDQTATEILGEMGAVKLPRLEEKFEYKDLSKKDLDDLGLSLATYYEGMTALALAHDLREVGRIDEANQEMQKANSLLPAIQESASSDASMALSQKEEQVANYKKHVKGKIQPTVELKKNTYTVKQGDKEITKSKVRVSVPAVGGSISKVNTLLIVPKDIADHVSKLTFSEDPEIVEEDPVVKWAFKNVPQDQVKDYTYTVDGDVQNFETVAVAAAKKPSWITRLIMLFIKK